jgi:hypothetical protein
MVPRAALVSHAPEDYPGGSCRQSEKADSEFPTTDIRQSSSFPLTLKGGTPSCRP